MTENLKHKRLHSFDDLVIECFKNDKEFAAFSIKSAFEDYIKNGEINYLLNTLRRVSSAFGMTNLSKKTGISRQNIYQMLSENGNPTIRNLELLLESFGYRLSIKKIKKPLLNQANF